MARASTIRRDSIEYGMQLILDDQGGARLTRIPGNLKANERAVELQVTLPIAVFRRPTMRAEINVQAHEVSIPPIKIDAVQSALRDSFGADLLITVQQQEQPQ